MWLRYSINDRIATQRYSSPEIPIGSRVMSRTTSAPSGRRSRKMVANVAGCRSFCTFRDCHTSIAFTPVGPQPNLAHIFGWIYGTDSKLKIFDPPDPRGVPGGILGGQKFKSPGNVMNCPENQYIFFKPHHTLGGPNGDFRGSKIQKSGKCHGRPRKSIIFFYPHPTLWLGVLGLKISKSLRNSINCRENGSILNP